VYYLSTIYQSKKKVCIPLVTFILHLILQIGASLKISFHIHDILFMLVLDVYFIVTICFQILSYAGSLSFHHHFSSNTIFMRWMSKTPNPPISFGIQIHFQLIRAYFFLMIRSIIPEKLASYTIYLLPNFNRHIIKGEHV
jgi:hypothetical protein